MAISIKTYNDLLGQMIRHILPNTPLNDINTGSALLTLLEAAASTDFDNNTAVLSLLELLNIDALRNNDLDARGADYGLPRITAQKATGSVTITDTTITKRSTGLYAVKPAPITGSNTIYVNDASAWASTGDLYIGRGTQSYEGPIPYTSITNNGSFFTITLGQALRKDHLSSDTVIDKQGKQDRRITAGTTVNIPANNQNPVIQYSILRDAVIAAGEDTITGVGIISQKAGSVNNAAIGTIVKFDSPPFPGAAVTNTSALSDGRDVESDSDYRERIKSYANTLARGTADAILSAIIGISDSTENKQVQSAVIKEPAYIGEPSIIYLDDGRGFQPSYAGQSVDTILSAANGTEQFLQLANYPLPRPQVVNVADGPFLMVDGMVLSVFVDGVEEAITFKSTQFRNISAATLSEIVIAINDQATTYKCRLDKQSSRLLLYPTEPNAETIQVIAIRASDNPALWANAVINFPTNKYSYISLYRNNTLLREKTAAAVLTTQPISSWGITPSGKTSGTLSIAVDNTPAQTGVFTVSDFGGLSLNAGTLTQWVDAINAKFAGLTAVATTSQAVQLTSNRTGAKSSLEVVGGDLKSFMFNLTPATSTGQDSDFQLNRQTGNLRVTSGITSGDSVTAGIVDAKGSIVSQSSGTGTFGLASTSLGVPAEAVVVADASAVSVHSAVSLTTSTLFTVTQFSPTVMRVMSNALQTFQNIQPHDFIYIVTYTNPPASLTWFHQDDCGLFKVKNRGGHVTAGVDSYIDLHHVGVNAATLAGPIIPTASDDIQAFKADVYPQVWRGADINNPASAAIQSVVDSINNNLANVKASIFKTSSVKSTSTTETGGSVASPVSVGNAKTIFSQGIEAQLGNQPHVANRTFNRDAMAFFKRSQPTKLNTFLDGWLNSDISGALTVNSPKSTDFVNDPYSETIQSAALATVSSDDQVAFGNGDNKGHYRSIKEVQANNFIGTQQNLPRTLFNHVVGDELTVMKSLSFSPDDNVVFIVDQDSINKTVVVPMSRTGRVNSAFPATNQAFSAWDQDNEPGINFDDLNVWGKVANKTEFKDYAVWFRARNWYVTGGVQITPTASMIVRAKEFGPHGESIRFKIEHPTYPSATAAISHINTPDHTTVQYVYGSDVARAISITGGLQFNVTSIGGGVYRHTFTGPIDLSTVLVGDIVGISNTSGVSTGNAGNFSITAKGANYIEVYNLNGGATGVGAPEVTSITAIADVIGTAAQDTVMCTAENANITLHLQYFTIYDDVGKVGVWYDVGNLNPPPPTIAGAYRKIRVATVAAADPAATVATKTAAVLNSDLKFSATVLTNTITITNNFRGVGTAGAADTSGFTVTFAAGTNDVSLNAKHFVIYDVDGPVAVWYDATGITPEPFHSARRAIRVSIVAGDSAAVVASKTAAALNSDGKWTVPLPIGATLIATDNTNGIRTDAANVTTSFTYSIVGGSNAAPETINSTSEFNIFPLITNTATEVVATLNTSPVVTAAVVGSGSLTFTKATREEVYMPGVGYAASLAYGHIPGNSNSDHIDLYDSHSWVKTFLNSPYLAQPVPNFALKTSLVLEGASTAYSMASAPNSDITDLGEVFKLIPVTLQNVYHHFTQKALSQLPIVADVDITNGFRRVQLKSKLLGSAGAVEIVGGRGNAADLSIFGDAQTVTDSGTEFIEVKVGAAPFTANIGDYVSVAQTNPVPRKFAASATDTMDVLATTTQADYLFNANTTLTGATTVTISDVSATYGRAAGYVWRWQFSAGTFTQMAVGNLLSAHGTTSWALAGNMAHDRALNRVSGFPVIAFDPALRWVDVVNPFGQALSATPIGSNAVQIGPSPIVRWHVQHTTSTHYRLEKLGFNDLFRLRHISGPSPKFVSCGVTVDDVVVIAGTTFNTTNNGKFAVLAVTEDSLVVQSSKMIEELDYTRPFNNSLTAVAWTSNSDYIAGSAGQFANLALGYWVKKPEDAAEYYAQVIAFLDGVNAPTSAALAVKIQLGSNYQGTSGSSAGIGYDGTIDINAGVILQSVDDIAFYRADSLQVNDSWFVDGIADSNWFALTNTGTYAVADYGVDTAYRPYIRVATKTGVSQTNRQLSVAPTSIYLIEGADNATVMIKEVAYTAIDEFDSTKRTVYLTSPRMGYKMSQSYGTKLSAMGKLSFDLGTVTGVDGYLYYTGLLQKVQRIVDGYEPDPVNYPGRRAIGGRIELLPPLIKRVQVAIAVTTNAGVNLNEITNDIASTIINYVNTLGVGEDVILSEITVKVMGIRGVAACTFTSPSPNTERIAIDDISKAFIEVQDISIA